MRLLSSVFSASTSRATATRRNDPSLARNLADDGVLVVGLGRFGTALAETLVSLGHEVLGVDSNPANVQRNAVAERKDEGMMGW